MTENTTGEEAKKTIVSSSKDKDMSEEKKVRPVKTTKKIPVVPLNKNGNGNSQTELSFLF